MKPGYVPVAPFVPLFEKWMQRDGLMKSEAHTLLADTVGITRQMAAKIMSGDSLSAPFNDMDAFVCTLLRRPGVWFSDALRDVYLSVDLTATIKRGGVRTGAKKDACRRGHEWTEEMTIWLATGHRRCRTCKRENDRERRRMKRRSRVAA